MIFVALVCRCADKNGVNLPARVRSASCIKLSLFSPFDTAYSGRQHPQSYSARIVCGCWRPLYAVSKGENKLSLMQEALLTLAGRFTPFLSAQRQTSATKIILVDDTFCYLNT